MGVFVPGAHAFVLRISSFVGLAPLRFRPQGNGYVVSMSNLMRIYSYLLIAVIETIALFEIVAEIKRAYVSAELEETIKHSLVCYRTYLICITSGIAICAAPYSVKTMLTCMSTIAAVDKSIDAANSSAKELRDRIGFYIFLFWCSLTFIIDVVVVNTSKWNLDLQKGYMLLLFINSILQMQFISIVIMVRRRFQVINLALGVIAKHVTRTYMDISNSSNTSTNFTIGEPSVLSQFEKSHKSILRKSVTGELRLVVPPSDAVIRIASLHSALCDMVHIINKSYGMSIYITVIFFLFYFIITSYFTILDFHKNITLTFITISQCLWMCHMLLRLVVLVEPCHNTIQEADKTRLPVCRMMMMCPTTSKLATHLQLFCHQLMLKHVHFMPMGLFIMDRSLVVTVIAATITYIVILVQFYR